MAEGYVMTIPKSVLDKLDQADAKINKIAASSERTRDRVRLSFEGMANSVDPFLRKLEALKSFGNFKLDATFKSSSTAAEKAADSIAKVATQLNKINDSSTSSSSAKTSVLAWQGINENLKIQQARLDAVNRSIKEYENTLARINAGKGGTVSQADQTAYNANLQEAQAIQKTIAAYELKQQKIITLQQAQRQQLQYEKELISLAQGSQSLPEQRKNDELRKMNQYYKELEVASAKEAKQAEKAAQAQEKAAAAAAKRAEAEKRRTDNKSEKDAANAIEMYNRALAKSEATIVQRARKIEALTNAQRALNSTSQGYTRYITKITSETQRLQKANEDAAKSMRRVKSSQTHLMDVSGQLARKLALTFSVSAIQGYVEKLITVRGEFELQNRALQAILQNKDEANALWEKTVQLAVRSPFQVKELVTYTKQLAAYRIESDKLYDTTKMLADVSAGLGVGMDRLILAYGQVKAANYLRASEVRQFTEAGVGLLQELATMYSELEGRMVSVGEVQQRITKRMVAFGDVEKVFQRLTSAGGIFYNMQEIQAETLSGMISNLKDNFDIMFNEIGEANDGILKGFIGIINTIVSQWKYFSIALNASVATLVVYAAKVAIATAANKGFAASSIEATLAQGGLTKAMAKTVLVFKNMKNFLVANPYILVIAGIAATILYFKNLGEQLDKTRAKFEILNNQIEKQKEGLDSLISKIEAQKEAQKNAEIQLSKYTKGTNEYKKAEKSANAERDKTQKLLNTLKKEYPEVYKNMAQNEKGVDSLRKAQKLYNDELDRTVTLNKLMQADTPLWGDSFRETSTNYAESHKREAKAIKDLESSYNALEKEVKFYLKTQKKIPTATKDQISSIINSDDSVEKKTKQLSQFMTTLRNTSTTSNRQLNTLSKDAEASLQEFENAKINRKNQTDAMNDMYVTLRENALKEAEVTLDEFKKLTKEQQQDIGKRMAVFIKSSAGAEEPIAQNFIKNRIKQDLGITISYDEKKVKKELDDLQKKLSEEVKKYNGKFKGKQALQLSVVTSETDVKEYRDKLFAAGKALIESAEENEKSIANLDGHISKEQKEAIKLAKEAGKAQQELAKLFGYIDKETKKQGESAYDKKMKAQLSLLKKMQSEYEKLRKTQGKNEASSTLTSTYGKAYSDLFNKPLKLKFDKGAIADEIDSIANTIGGKTAETLKQSFHEASSQMRAEISISATEESISNFEREIENLFRGYELSIELKSLGLDSDLMKQLFNIDVSKLSDIKQKLSEMYPNPEELGEKQMSSYYKILKQISDAEKSEYDQRLKDYVKYLKTSQGERLRIEMEYQEKVAKIPKEFTETQRADIKENLGKEKQEKLDKQTWEDFTGSSYYVTLFQDLDTVSSQALENLLVKLEELRGSLGDLPASDLKAISDQIIQVQNELESRNPFKNLGSSLLEYIGYLRQKNELEKAFEDSTNRETQLQEEVDLRSKSYQISLKEYNSAVKTYGAESNQAKAAQSKMNISHKLLQTSNKELEAQKKTTEEIAEQQRNGKKLQGTLANAADAFAAGIQGAIGLIDQIGGSGGGFDASKESTKEILGGIGGMASGVGKMMSGDWIGGAMSALSGLATTIGGIFGIDDKKREEEIQNELKLVGRLESSYKRLERAIDKAYTIDTFNKSYENAEQNLKEQNESYRRMIEAERGKKDADDERIQQWMDAIEDNNEKIEDLRNQKIQELGGFGAGMGDAAQEFASAWMEAYMETGDGLDALNEKWDEFIQNIIVKQLALRTVSNFLEPIMKMIDEAIGTDSYLSTDELAKIEDAIAKTTPKMNEAFKNIMDSFGGLLPEPGSASELTGLQTGIQGITAEQSGIIEAYLNSMRFFVADTNMQIQKLALFFSADPAQNPMYSELMAQTRLLRSIDDRLASVITSAGNHELGGFAIKSII